MNIEYSIYNSNTYDNQVEKKGKVKQFLTSESAKKLAIASIKVLQVAVIILLPFFLGVIATIPLITCPIIGIFTFIPIMCLSPIVIFNILDSLEKVEANLKKSLKTQKAVEKHQYSSLS
ncbi:MAG: hypothetical protein QRY74_02825 [Chlamydia sp.]